MVTIKDIKKLAELSRLEISEKEEEMYVKDFESIFGYVDLLGKAVTESGKGEKDLAQLHNVMREDVDVIDSEVYTEDILKNMPDTEKGYLKVKKILNQGHE